MLKNIFAAARRAQQIVMLFDDVRDVRKCWIEGSYKGYTFRFVDVFGLFNNINVILGALNFVQYVVIIVY